MEYLINSSNVEKITWSNDVLTVFLITGEITRYLNVPSGIAEGIKTAVSAGSYLNRHVRNQFESKRIDAGAKQTDELKKLTHHRDCTVGLWATDKPHVIPPKLKHLFFEIKY